MLEHSTRPVFFALPGRLLKVATDDAIHSRRRPDATGLGRSRPDGALYVSNRSTSIDTGEVLRIEP